MFPENLTPAHLNIISQGTLLTHLGIEFTEIGENYIIAKMPVKDETSQPMGILHYFDLHLVIVYRRDSDVPQDE